MRPINCLYAIHYLINRILTHFCCVVVCLLGWPSLLRLGGAAVDDCCGSKED